jgi:hypothetical protein
MRRSHKLGRRGEQVRANLGTLPGMLFIVVEHFRSGGPGPVGARFRERGRMLPDGVTYHNSWMEISGTRCFQLMEAGDAGLLNQWTSRWNDLVDFEITPVLTSAEFWSRKL